MQTPRQNTHINVIILHSLPAFYNFIKAEKNASMFDARFNGKHFVYLFA